MRIKKGSLSYWFLLALEGTVEGIEVFSYSGQMRSLRNLPSTTKASSLAETIRRLRKKGLVEEEKHDDGKRILKLTESGREVLGIGTNWDGKYRIVIWDIPESKRTTRDLFRRKLRRWGFKNWQRSVWISKKNVTEDLRKFIFELEMEKWVAVIESNDPSLSHIKFNDRGS